MSCVYYISIICSFLCLLITTLIMRYKCMKRLSFDKDYKRDFGDIFYEFICILIISIIPLFNIFISIMLLLMYKESLEIMYNQYIT